LIVFVTCTDPAQFDAVKRMVRTPGVANDVVTALAVLKGPEPTTSQLKVVSGAVDGAEFVAVKRTFSFLKAAALFENPGGVQDTAVPEGNVIVKFTFAPLGAFTMPITWGEVVTPPGPKHGPKAVRLAS
jgi:hypothetical protein